MISHHDDPKTSIINNIENHFAIKSRIEMMEFKVNNRLLQRGLQSSREQNLKSNRFAIPKGAQTLRGAGETFNFTAH